MMAVIINVAILAALGYWLLWALFKHRFEPSAELRSTYAMTAEEKAEADKPFVWSAQGMADLRNGTRR